MQNQNTNQMNIKKKNSEEAKMLSLDLQQKTEIDQKVNYYKSILKALVYKRKNKKKLLFQRRKSTIHRHRKLRDLE